MVMGTAVGVGVCVGVGDGVMVAVGDGREVGVSVGLLVGVKVAAGGCTVALCAAELAVGDTGDTS
jgi:hypothetical protein